MTSLHPVLARLSGRPLALAPRALDGLLAASQPIQARPAALPFLREAEPMAPRGYAMTESGVAVVPVIGPLVSRGDWLSMLLGAPSYGEIGDAVAAAFADPAGQAVLLEVDSPGGEIGGLFDLVDRIAALRDASGKPLWAVASESALSAAFAIASVADRLYVTRTAEIGSVGVVAIHVDESAADAMAGLKWTLIHAGARKIDGNPHEPLSGSARTDIQADVDALHAELVALVARNRGMSAEAVGATEAAIYRGQRAVSVGFADRLGTVGQALADLTESLASLRPRLIEPRRGGAASSQLPRRTSAMTTDTTTNAPADPPAAAHETPEHAPDPDPGTEPVMPARPAPAVQPAPEQTVAAAAPSADAADQLRAEFAEVAAIAAQAARLGVTVDAAEALRQGIKPDALRRSVLDTLGARAEASAVVALAPSAASAGDSPIVRRARERAAAARN
ncbi:MAG TPA: S49 family peptidase [Xanthobacteraceae bacterium]|nr:S49 family peptidase [Xanthobacteraceae bacterium]